MTLIYTGSHRLFSKKLKGTACVIVCTRPYFPLKLYRVCLSAETWMKQWITLLAESHTYFSPMATPWVISNQPLPRTPKEQSENSAPMTLIYAGLHRLFSKKLKGTACVIVFTRFYLHVQFIPRPSAGWNLDETMNNPFGWKPYLF